jgi:hypothetical protein
MDLPRPENASSGGLGLSQRLMPESLHRLIEGGNGIPTSLICSGPQSWSN